MITYLGVLYISNLNIEDIAFREDSINIIDMQSDITLASEQLNIKMPFSVDDARKIATYINKRN